MAVGTGSFSSLDASTSRGLYFTLYARIFQTVTMVVSLNGNVLQALLLQVSEGLVLSLVRQLSIYIPSSPGPTNSTFSAFCWRAGFAEVAVSCLDGILIDAGLLVEVFNWALRTPLVGATATRYAHCRAHLTEPVASIGEGSPGKDL